MSGFGVALRFGLTTARVFEPLLGNAKDMIEIHQRLGGNPGRRFGEMSLNRAAVVLAVAAWQAFVEEVARDAIDLLGRPAPTPTYRLVRADVMSAIGRFNTPNARNSVDLLTRTGFDPSLNWTFSIRWPWARLTSGGVYYSSKTYRPADASSELDGWLLVRHRIAHGRDLDAPEIAALLSGSAGGVPSLRKADAERCIAFFEALAGATEQAAATAFT